MISSANRRVAQIAQQLSASPVLAGPNHRFNGQVCIVTGGCRGIGYAVGSRLCSEGARVLFIFDVLDSSDAARDLQQAYPQTKVVSKQLDLTQEAAVQMAVSEVLSQFGAIDVLVQAAGVTGKTNVKTHEVDTADFMRVFDVNVKAIFLCAKAVLPSMLNSGYGRIVNIASISGKDGNAGMLAYSSSKAAVINLTKVIGKDYVNMGKDITVNCVAPAVVQTAMVDAMPPEQVKYMTDKIPMARTGKLEEVASTIAFAASKECSFTTGYCFDCSGGRAVY